MRTIFLFFIFLAFSVHGAIRDIYLPIWNENETSQTVEFQLYDLPQQELQFFHSCGISSDTGVFTPKNGSYTIQATLDLHKLASTFSICVLSKNSSGKFSTIVQRVDLHLSLVPEKYRMIANKVSFQLTSLTHNALEIAEVSNVTITNQTMLLIEGTYNIPAVITLRNGEHIHIKPNVK